MHKDEAPDESGAMSMGSDRLVGGEGQAIKAARWFGLLAFRNWPDLKLQ